MLMAIREYLQDLLQLDEIALLHGNADISQPRTKPQPSLLQKL